MQCLVQAVIQLCHSLLELLIEPPHWSSVFHFFPALHTASQKDRREILLRITNSVDTKESKILKKTESILFGGSATIFQIKITSINTWQVSF